MSRIQDSANRRGEAPIQTDSPRRTPSGNGGATLPMSEDTYRHAIENAISAGVASCDVDGRQTYVNRALCDMLGWQAEDLIGAYPPYIYWPEEELEAIQAAMQATLEGRAPEEGFDLRFRTRTGERIDVLLSISPLVGANGEVDGYLASVSDISRQKEVESRLRESERRLRFTLDSAKLGTWEWDMRSGEVQWSENLERIHGFEPGTFGSDFESFLADVRSDFVDTVKGTISDAIERGGEYRIEYPLVPKAGTEVWVEARGQVILDEAGQPIGMSGVCMDVTERKNAESEVQRLNRDLRHKLDEMQTILDVTPIGLAVALDPECMEITANPSFAAMLGVPSDVNTSKSGSDGARLPFKVIRDGREVDASELPMQKAAREQVYIRGEEFEIHRRDGAVLTLLEYASPLFDEIGEVRGALGAFVDITELKRAERRVAESEERFRHLANSMPQIVWTADPGGRAVFVNERWRELSGLNEERTNDPAFMARVIHEEDLEKLYAEWNRAVEAARRYEVEYRLRHVSGGSYRWFLARSEPIRDENGAIVEWFGTATDIHDHKETLDALRAQTERTGIELAERRRAEDELRLLNETLEERVRRRTAELEQMNRRLKSEIEDRLRTERHLARANVELGRANAELKRSNRELQDFAHVASHDLQEPLRKISSFADLIRVESGEHLDERGSLYVDRIQDAALRMSELISDLLSFSHVRAREVPFEPVDLNAVAETVLADLELQVKEAGGLVEVDDLPTVEGDPVQMRQLFQNLISNALKFHRCGVPPVVQVRSEQVGASHVLIFADNGIGFDEKYADRIFSPFQRLHPREEYDGSGMGLTICRRIVDRHRGEITVRSVPGKGTTFSVELPPAARVSV